MHNQRNRDLWHNCKKEIGNKQKLHLNASRRTLHDYYRTLEDLPVIDDLIAYDDIRLFPELYDTSTIIERITGEADLIERQL